MYIFTQKMQGKNRILTIDIMRGITLFLMLFVNDPYVAGVPRWLTHREADFDGMGLADWVFPGFLFMVGMAVPFAVQNRINKGDSTWKLIKHIVVRTVSLLIIGVLMLNVERLNPELSGIGKYIWAILVYICIFLIWNHYNNLNKKVVTGLKALAFLGLFVLLYVFKAGTPDEISWIETGWWGILGLIGWGYLVSSLAYLVTKDNLLWVGLIWMVFVALNIFSQLQLLNVTGISRSVFGVIIDGSTPSMVLSGMFFSVLLRKTSKKDYLKFIIIGFLIGIFILASGFVLRNWFIISKMKGTPSWAMICNGISMLFFMILYVLIDIGGIKKWTFVFKPAGQNSLTTYLAPNVLYYLFWGTGFNALFYKGSEYGLVLVVGSLCWAFSMIAFAALLSRLGIRLKL